MNFKLQHGIIFTAILFFLFPFITIEAQQLPLLNQNRASLNPAYVSSDYFKYDLATNASLRYRHQWTDIKGAPRTIFGNFNHYSEDSRFLFGADIVNDETGPTGFTGLYGRAGYVFEINNDFMLSTAVGAGMVQYRVKGSELNFLEEGDVANNDATKFYPDLSLGTMLYYKKHYYLGFSVPQVIGLDLTFKDGADEYDIERVRHYSGIIGGRYDFGGGSWIEASSESRFVPDIPFYVNGRVQFDYRDMFWVAAIGSSSKEFGAEVGVLKDVGVNSNLLKFSYGFSNFFQSYGVHFGTVHEVGVSFSW